jgi:hypothetical protein
MQKCLYCGYLIGLEGYALSKTSCERCPPNTEDVFVPNLSFIREDDESGVHFCNKCPKGEYTFEYPGSITAVCMPCPKGYREKADKTNCEIDPAYIPPTSTSGPSARPTNIME